MKIAQMMVSQQWSHNTKNAAIVNMHAWVSCWGMSKCLQPVQSLLCSAENILFILGECSRHFVGPFTGLHPEVCALNFGGGLSLHLENKHKSGVCCQLSPRLRSKCAGRWSYNLKVALRNLNKYACLSCTVLRCYLSILNTSALPWNHTILHSSAVSLSKGIKWWIKTMTMRGWENQKLTKSTTPVKTCGLIRVLKGSSPPPSPCCSVDLPPKVIKSKFWPTGPP